MSIKNISRWITFLILIFVIVYSLWGENEEKVPWLIDDNGFEISDYGVAYAILMARYQDRQADRCSHILYLKPIFPAVNIYSFANKLQLDLLEEISQLRKDEDIKKACENEKLLEFIDSYRTEYYDEDGNIYTDPYYSKFMIGNNFSQYDDQYDAGTMTIAFDLIDNENRRITIKLMTFKMDGLYPTGEFKERDVRSARFEDEMNIFKFFSWDSDSKNN